MAEWCIIHPSIHPSICVAVFDLTPFLLISRLIKKIHTYISHLKYTGLFGVHKVSLLLGPLLTKEQFVPTKLTPTYTFRTEHFVPTKLTLTYAFLTAWLYLNVIWVIWTSSFKGLVHPKMKIKSLITHPHAVPTP